MNRKESPEPENPFPVTLTPVAAAKLREALAREGFGEAAGVRIGVVPGGCSGFSYAMSLAESPQPGDRVADQGGVRLFVSPEDAERLEGAVVDYVESLTSAGFRFSNPKAVRTCGCGTSFS